MLWILCPIAFLYGVLIYVALEQAWQAAATGEDDLLGLAPAFARLRGIDYEARAEEYALRMNAALGMMLDAQRDAERILAELNLEPTEYEWTENGELTPTAWRQRTNGRTAYVEERLRREEAEALEVYDRERDALDDGPLNPADFKRR